VSHVDHAHQPENDREPECHQDEDAGQGEAGEGVVDEANFLLIAFDSLEAFMNRLLELWISLARKHGVKLPDVRINALLKMARQPVSLDAPVGDDGDVSVADFIEDKAAENPSESTSYNLLKEKLDDVLTSLTERERRILEMRFGLADGYGRTLEEIGNMYNVTRERIRQIEAKGLRKLRHPTRLRRLHGFLESRKDAA